MRLAGKTAIITGGASGMGCAAVMEFLRQGAKVAFADINAQAVGETLREAREISPEILGISADLTEEAACKRVVEQTAAHFGGVDVLFNNLGINLSAEVCETSVEQWDKVFAVNVRAMFLMCKYTLPLMMAQKRGAVINTASAGGAAALKGLAAYSASKGAVISLTRSIAVDYAPYNIRANYLIPGVILTKMTQMVIDAQEEPEAYAESMRTNNLLHRFGQEQEIAMAAVYLASDETGFMTGASLVADGGYLAQ